MTGIWGWVTRLFGSSSAKASDGDCDKYTHKPLIAALVRSWLSTYHHVPPDSVEPETRWRELGLDWLDACECVMTIETKLDTTLPNVRYSGWKTVGEFVDEIHYWYERKLK